MRIITSRSNTEPHAAASSLHRRALLRSGVVVLLCLPVACGILMVAFFGIFVLSGGQLGFLGETNKPGNQPLEISLDIIATGFVLAGLFAIGRYVYSRSMRRL